MAPSPTFSAARLQTAAAFIPIPCVGAVASAAGLVVKFIEGMRGNDQFRKELCNRILMLMSTIITPLKGRSQEHFPPELQASIEKLTRDLQGIQVDLGVYLASPEDSMFKIRTRWTGFINHAQVTEQLKGCSSNLEWAIKVFQVDGLIQSQLEAAERHAEAMAQCATRHSEIVAHLFEGGTRHSEVITSIEELGLHVQAGSSSAVLPQLPSIAMPPKLEIFHGRHDYVEGAIASIIDHPEGARLAIMGPGGMGKTSISLAIIHDVRITVRFKKCRYWVPCGQATSIPLLTQLVAKSLEIKSPSSDPLQDIRSLLEHSQLPRLFIFDNFETLTYIKGMNAEVDRVVSTIASFPNVCIIITMRGEIRPCPNMRWTQPPLKPLLPLSLDAARQTFIDMNPQVTPSRHLDELLKMLDFVPLAITIMATLSQMGETPLELIQRFRSERSGLLHQGDDPMHSIGISVSTSLTSNPMRADPEALILLQILSMLPGGAKVNQISSLAPNLRNPKGSLNTLRRVSLIYVTNDHVIRVLSPIRSFILDNHQLPNPHRQSLYQCYYELAERASYSGTPEFLQAKQEMANEEANMDYVLLDALDQEEDSRNGILASIDYTWFLYAHIPRTEVILKAIQTSERQERMDLLPNCLYVKGQIEYGRDCYDVAIDDITRAKQLYELRQDQGGVASCTRRLGDILLLLSRFDEARAHLEDAMQMLVDAGDDYGVAKCLQSLGDILRAQDRFKEAQVLFQAAKIKFEQTDDALGAVQCMQRLGVILHMQDQYEDARALFQDAKTKFEDIGSARGVAQCLQGLGEILHMQDQYDEARVLFQNAKTQFQHVGSALGEAQCLQSLGDIFHMQDQYDEARAFLQDARTSFESIGDTVGVAECARSLAEIPPSSRLYRKSRAENDDST